MGHKSAGRRIANPAKRYGVRYNENPRSVFEKKLVHVPER